MKCEQEMCPFWSGSGCVCDVVGIGSSDVRLAANASEGWASYAAEQERHAETGRRLEELKNGIANLHDRYAAPPSAPRCCPDCAANDLPNELRLLLRDAQ
jgi:hypothetical protein